MTTDYSVRNTTFLEAVDLDAIAPSALNPRKHFDEPALQELTDSIREHGLLQPIVVRQVTPRGAVGLETAVVEIDGRTREPRHQVRYEIVAGERRWLACRRAGLTSIPVQVRHDLDDATALRLMLVENLQRQDIDPIDEAEGYRRLNVELGLKQREIANAVKRSQPAVANRMRLLELPNDVQKRIRRGELTPAHGVALARFKEFPGIASKLAEMAAAQQWPTRALEEKLPGRWELNQRGLIVQVHEGSIGGVDTSVCESCPFGAYWSDGEGYYRFCLKPEHHRELVAAAQAEAARKAQEAIENAAAGGEKLPKLSDLPRSGYEMRSYYQSVKACTAECPCRRKAIGDGGEVVEICMDPARCRRLKAEQTTADRRDKKAQHKRLREQVVTAVDAIEVIGIRELAIVAAAALCSVSRTSATKKAARHATGTIDFEKFARYELRQKFRELARLPELNLIRLVVEALLGDELANRFEGYGSSSDMTEWYLAQETPGPSPSLMKLLGLGRGDEPTLREARSGEAIS